MKKLFVGNLPYTTTDQELTALFAPYGTVLSAIIINDKYSGRSKGFGFVEIEDDAAADKAIAELNGQQNAGRSLVVSVARPREERPMGGGGGYQGGGDNRGGGGRDFSRGGGGGDRRDNRR